MALPRGFRAEAERTALRLRENAGLAPTDPLDLETLANSLGARVVPADALVNRERLHEIERIQAYAFSACTFEINGISVVVYNPIHSEARQRSDIAHELAHIVLEHDLTEIQYLSDVAFRTCQPAQEEEATTLGGTILVPRPALLAAAQTGADVNDIAGRFGVTRQMAQFRLNTTGVQRQLNARAAARHGSPSNVS